jgi:hypothetical protein
MIRVMGVDIGAQGAFSLYVDGKFERVIDMP